MFLPKQAQPVDRSSKFPVETSRVVDARNSSTGRYDQLPPAERDLQTQISTQYMHGSAATGILHVVYCRPETALRRNA